VGWVKARIPVSIGVPFAPIEGLTRRVHNQFTGALATS
jgi:hypothetical protein